MQQSKVREENAHICQVKKMLIPGAEVLDPIGACNECWKAIEREDGASMFNLSIPARKKVIKPEILYSCLGKFSNKFPLPHVTLVEIVESRTYIAGETNLYKDSSKLIIVQLFLIITQNDYILSYIFTLMTFWRNGMRTMDREKNHTFWHRTWTQAGWTSSSS